MCGGGRREMKRWGDGGDVWGGAEGDEEMGRWLGEGCGDLGNAGQVEPFHTF